MEEKNTNPIDFIIIWVDGNDKQWQAEKAKYDGKTVTNANSEVRFRDWDNLQYWFRGVEKFAPWVNKIHFVTWGHLPKWLDTTNPKLNIVNHKDYIPSKYLPTFNSHTIELNLHRIKGLSEQFVYFNDDMFITAPTKPEDFFKDGMPCDTFALDCICFNKDSAGFFNGADVSIINDHFDKEKVFKRDWKKWYSGKNGMKNHLKTTLLLPWHWFPGFYYQHTPSSFMKATFEEIWEKEYDALDSTCMDKFRKTGNVNQWLMKFWQLAAGNYTVRRDSFAYCYHVKEYNYPDLCRDIPSQKHNMICINDTAETTDFEVKKQGVIDAFEKLLPEKSTFEL